jgi:hypothetical protein
MQACWTVLESFTELKYQLSDLHEYYAVVGQVGVSSISSLAVGRR